MKTLGLPLPVGRASHDGAGEAKAKHITAVQKGDEDERHEHAGIYRGRFSL
jgi:hypothetical protein